MACNRRQGNLMADDGGRLQQPLLFRRQAVDARCQDCLDGVRDHSGRLPHAAFSDGPGQLLEEEGIACRGLGNGLLPRARVGL